MRTKIIEEKLAEIVKEAGSNEIGDVLAALGIRLRRIDANRPLLHGTHSCLVRSKKNLTIYLSRRCPKTLIPFTIAHEIGHAVLHDIEIAHFGAFRPKTEIEHEADYFALRLLNIRCDLSDFYGYSDEEIARIIGVRESTIPYLA